MTPQLTVAVLTYNGEQLLPDCLTSIFQQEFPVPTELLILDNGSEEPVSWPMPCTPTSYPKNLERVRIERVEPNCGNIGGQNRCFEQARGEWVLFVANDIRFHVPWIAEAYYVVTTFPHRPVGQLQPKLITPLGDVDNAGLAWHWPGYGISRKTSRLLPKRTPLIITSSCFLMKKSVWAEMGGFDEQLISSHEDVDMGLRLEKFGYKKLVSLDRTVIHLGNATLKHTLPNHRAAFHRARRMVIRKHYHGLDQWTRLGAEWVIYHLGFLSRMKQ